MQCKIVVLLVIFVETILAVTANEEINLWLVQLNENDYSIENIDELADRYGYRLYRRVS